MNIALVGKFEGAAGAWRMESFVQRALWDLGHEVYGIRRQEPPEEPDWDAIGTLKEGDEERNDAQIRYEAEIANWHRQLDGITEVDLTLVIQGYGIPPEAVEACRRRTGKPVVCWHGEVMGDHWPTDDDIVQGKVAWLRQNIAAYDMVIHNCVHSLPMLRQLGAQHVACVPVSGVDVNVHRRMPQAKKQIDVLIYGWASQRRYDLVKAIVDQLPAGTTYVWPDPSQGYYGESLMELINFARVVLNTHFSETFNVETRIYEALGCGVPVVSEPVSMPELFPEGCGVRYGHTPEQLAAQIQHILGMDPSEYLGFADAGYELVHQRYSYQARCQQLLDVVAKEFG